VHPRRKSDDLYPVCPPGSDRNELLPTVRGRVWRIEPPTDGKLYGMEQRSRLVRRRRRWLARLLSSPFRRLRNIILDRHPHGVGIAVHAAYVCSGPCIATSVQGFIPIPYLLPLRAPIPFTILVTNCSAVICLKYSSLYFGK